MIVVFSDHTCVIGKANHYTGRREFEFGHRLKVTLSGSRFSSQGWVNMDFRVHYFFDLANLFNRAY